MEKYYGTLFHCHSSEPYKFERKECHMLKPCRLSMYLTIYRLEKDQRAQLKLEPDTTSFWLQIKMICSVFKEAQNTCIKILEDMF